MNRTDLFIMALVISAVLHGVGVYCLSDCSFTTIAEGFQANRKWTHNVPTMHVSHFEGDPLSPEAHASGTPAPAPVEEKPADRVDRLSGDSASERNVPALPTAAALAPDEQPAPVPPEACVFSPRAEILMRHDPQADDPTSVPQRVADVVPRAASAPDIAPPQDLLSSSLISPVRGGSGSAAASHAAFGNGVGSEGDMPAPPPVVLPPTGFGLGVAGKGEARLAAPTPEAPEAEKKVSEKEKPAEPVPEAVMPEVKEATVVAEKAAVKALRDTADDVQPFAENVRCSLAHWVSPGPVPRKYFRIRVSSRAEKPLPVVAKDVVYMIDVSGSIGSERLRACAQAIAQEIRTLNPKDRFNVVAFRGTFSYAFTRWMAADSIAADQAVKWVNKLTAGGSTDVFATLRSVLTLPRDPARPMIALVVTDGEATSGLTRSAEIISSFTGLNGGLVSVYMYGVKENANAYLMDMLARGNRGGWARHRHTGGIFVQSDKIAAADGIPTLAEKFRDPVLSDIQVVFAASARADAYPHHVTNLYQGEPIDIWGVCPADQQELVFSMRGLNGERVYENVFRLVFDAKPSLTEEAPREWAQRRIYEMVGDYTSHPGAPLRRELEAFAKRYNVQIPYVEQMEKITGSK